MKRIIFAFAAMFVLAVAGAAQQAAQQAPPTSSTSPVFDAVRKLVATMSKNIEAGAEEMPADKYDFRPTPQQNTFGHLVVHMITANYGFCSIMSGAGMSQVALPKDTDPKDTLTAALKSSFDFCAQSLAKLDDSKLEQQVSMGRGTTVLGPILITFSQDYGDHYAQEAAYLRAAGLLPPTAPAPPKG